MTFLEICQALNRRTIQGTGPAAVTSQTGMLLKIVNWVADADAEICAMWSDWRFLHTEFTENTITGTATISKPSDLGAWDQDSFYLERTASSYKKLASMDYYRWRDMYRNGVKTNGKPSFVIEKPSRDLVLEPPPDATYSLTADYWKVAPRLAANSDTSLIPARFHLIVVARAEMWFAKDQEDLARMKTATDEYRFLLGQLEASQLPGQEGRTFGASEITVVCA